MKPIENNKQKFTKLNDSLRRISVKEVTSTQKIFFAYIIGWQEKGKTLTAKNKYIADQLGLTESGIRKAISTSKKFDFFSSVQLGNKKGENGYTSTHEIKIDADKFEKYLKLNHSKTAFYEKLNEPENEPDEVQEQFQPVLEEVKTAHIENTKELTLDDLYNIQLSSYTPEEFHQLTNNRFTFTSKLYLAILLKQVQEKGKDANREPFTLERIINKLLEEEKTRAIA